ncbi:hypothetical protein [Acinetobacter oleivorans]|uniref:hypothetical protein n=1 Tax=Acinetobacter oleivorans TaxID=1148157 RepID=UPI0012502FEF|nr:hypothetical protein [Acinetobacter oleivorans]
MMNICIEAVDLILDAIYSIGERDELLSQFTIREPNSLIWSHGIGTEIYIRNQQDYLKALVFIKQNGASYLRKLPTSEVRNKVTNFLTENFWFIREGEFSRNPNISYKIQIPVEAKLNLANALLNSSLFKEELNTFLYPFNSIHLENDLMFDNFFIINSQNLSLHHMNIDVRYSNEFDFLYYPSIRNENHNRKRISTWIGIKAPTEEISRRTLYSVLGTISLFEESKKRYCFNSRCEDSGCSYFSNQSSYTYRQTQNLTPSLYFKLKVKKELAIQLEHLSSLLKSNDKTSQRSISALTSFYKSWFEKDAEQYRTFCSCIEALIEDTRSKSSQKFRDLSKSYITKFSETQLKDLLKIRGNIVHGKAPHLYDSENYDFYVERYLSEPRSDLLEIVEKVLKKHIFQIQG